MTPERIAQLLPLLAPEFIGDPRFELAVELVEEEVNADHCYYDRVVILMAAHMLAITSPDAIGGQAISKSEGQLSITYAKREITGGMDGSAYGREAARLTLLCGGGFTAMTRMFPVDEV